MKVKNKKQKGGGGGEWNVSSLMKYSFPVGDILYLCESKLAFAFKPALV